MRTLRDSETTLAQPDSRAHQALVYHARDLFARGEGAQSAHDIYLSSKQSRRQFGICVQPRLFVVVVVSLSLSCDSI